MVDDEVITNWQIIPLEFKRAWNKQLSGWHPIQVRDATPALYRVGFVLKKIHTENHKQVVAGDI